MLNLNGLWVIELSVVLICLTSLVKPFCSSDVQACVSTPASVLGRNLASSPELPPNGGISWRQSREPGFKARCHSVSPECSLHSAEAPRSAGQWAPRLSSS